MSASQILARLRPVNDQQGSIVAIRALVGGIIVAASGVVGQMASFGQGRTAISCRRRQRTRSPRQHPCKSGFAAFCRSAGENQVRLDDGVSGRVRLVSPAVDAATQLGQVRISLTQNPCCRVGIFARATIELDNSCAVAVPLSALLFGPDGSVVQMIRDNRAETRRVTVGIFAKNSVQIREGVMEGRFDRRSGRRRFCAKAIACDL